MALFRSVFAIALIWLAFVPVAIAEVNVNSATASELESLPGIGPAKAAAIMQFRQDHGPFESLSELDAVPGIGPATLQNISSIVTFSGETTAVLKTTSHSSSKKAVSPGQVINLNTATQVELESLPGIGPSKAAAIIDYRHTNGAFSGCTDLVKVRGIGDATVKNIAPQCIVE